MIHADLTAEQLAHEFMLGFRENFFCPDVAPSEYEAVMAAKIAVVLDAKDSLLQQYGDAYLDEIERAALVEAEISLECRNKEFWRNIVMECARLCGPEVFISDDGSVQDEPLALKVVDCLKTKDIRLRDIIREMGPALLDLAIAADTAELMLQAEYPAAAQSLRGKVTEAKAAVARATKTMGREP